MKYFFASLALCFVSMGVWAHNIDTVSICGHKLEIPAELKLTKKHELTGAGYSLNWEYVSKKDLENLPEKTIASFNKNLKNVTQLYLLAYFLYEPCKAYGFTYDDEAGNRAGELVIFAEVNNQPVYVQVKLTSTVFENEQLPVFINRLIVLGK